MTKKGRKPDGKNGSVRGFRMYDDDRAILSVAVAIGMFTDQNKAFRAILRDWAERQPVEVKALIDAKLADKLAVVEVLP